MVAYMVLCCSPSVYGSVDAIERPAGNVLSSEVHGIKAHRQPSSASKVIPIKVLTPMPIVKGMKVAASASKKTSGLDQDVVIEADESEVELMDDSAWDSAVKRFDQNDPAGTKKQIKVEDIIEPTSEYHYIAGRRKNPFIPGVVLGRPNFSQERTPEDVEIPIINPLQSFSVNQLSVIGVWEGDDRVWKALIKTPNNQGIETKLGDPAGNSGGRIMSIAPEAVIVREFSVRSDGTREYRDIPIYMGSDKEVNDNSPVGGRLILRPGAPSPEIELPDRETAVPLIQPGIEATLNPQTMKTIVPGSEIIRSLRGIENTSQGSNQGTSEGPRIMAPAVPIPYVKDNTRAVGEQGDGGLK
jgi:Tfp pilus assembly protein PilP